ncbi:WXG100 family type VII secretion target [Nocardioides flavescens]|uniref:WXG100 family type VII secretion target n=1 Tax=Nocardioides flavescens TaxID=2691959 RepID=A0A6L7F1Z0_9ACTN|nr:WXG100 family type VII secretion target [Nocardioides flavescens]MXG89144.1 WXG100 family type VII secretion target [Nocardioides flavescens]
MTQQSGEMKAGEGTLKAAAEMVDKARSKFMTDSGKLSNDIESLQAKWQGQGGTAFFNLQRAWKEKHEKIVGALSEFEASLRSTEKDNVTTDQSQSDYMAKNNARLGGVQSY